jgi:hypothetical protein
MTVRW